MNSTNRKYLHVSPLLAWLSVALAGVVAPVTAMLLIANGVGPASFNSAGAAILAVGMMGTGMIAAAVSGRFWVGFLLALLSGVSLALFANAFDMPTLEFLPFLGLSVVVSSISFAVRGALFATSSADRGCWIAMFVVAGEAAIIATAAAEPGAIPEWLLVLLPAQWTSIALQSAFTGSFNSVAIAALFALGGTAAATLLVRQLWPRRWTYLVMFTTWLSLSALVYHQS